MRKLAAVCACILLSGVLLSSQEQTVSESQQQDWALIWKLANDAVQARADALKKVQEFKDYETALKTQAAMKAAIEGKVPQGFVFDFNTGKLKPK